MGDKSSHFHCLFLFWQSKNTEESKLLSKVDRNYRIGEEYSTICFHVKPILSDVEKHSTICFRTTLKLSNKRAPIRQFDLAFYSCQVA